MKIGIDFSVYKSPVSAFARISGTLDLPEIPNPGEYVSFVHALHAADFDPNEFSGVLRVESRCFNVGVEIACTLIMEDVVLENGGDAEGMVVYFEKGFGLFGERY